MLPRIGADDLDVSMVSLRVARRSLPFLPRKFDRITRVRNDIQSEAQIVRGDSVSETVTLSLYVDGTEILQPLLDRIDSQIDGFQVPRDQLRERGLPTPWKPGEDVEHRCVEFCCRHSRPPQSNTRYRHRMIGSWRVMIADRCL